MSTLLIMSSQASGLLYLPPLLSENISWSPSKVWLVKLAFSKATPFFLLQPTRRTCCSRHLFVPLSSSHLVLSNIFHRIFFNIQIVFFPVHFDSHISAAMNDLHDKILFSLVLSSVLISWLFRFPFSSSPLSSRYGAVPFLTIRLILILKEQGDKERDWEVVLIVAKGWSSSFNRKRIRHRGEEGMKERESHRRGKKLVT